MTDYYAVLGIGCSLLYNTAASYFRLSERFHLLWLFSCNKDESKELFPYRSPVPAVDASEPILESKYGSVRLLLSPNTAATSSLNISVVTIKPKGEIPSKRAAAVEFYYVLQGSGAFSQQGVIETSAIQEGDCFVVDVGSMRWISNSKGSEDLLLLRATDGGDQYNHRETADQIRRDPNYKSKSTIMIRNGIQKLKSKANGYHKLSSSKSNGNGGMNGPEIIVSP